MTYDELPATIATVLPASEAGEYVAPAAAGPMPLSIEIRLSQDVIANAVHRFMDALNASFGRVAASMHEIAGSPEWQALTAYTEAYKPHAANRSALFAKRFRQLAEAKR
jgi:hypothetical protein